MLKEAYIKYITRNLLKRRKETVMMDYKSSRKIAIICSDQFEDDKQIINVTEQLKKEGKEVSLLIFCHNIKKKVSEQPYFHSGDITFAGKLKNDLLNHFINQHYDFALCFDQSENYLIDYVFSQLNTKCRVGIVGPTRNHHFEMMIQSDDPKTPVSGEVLKYLKMIQPYGY